MTEQEDLRVAKARQFETWTELQRISASIKPDLERIDQLLAEANRERGRLEDAKNALVATTTARLCPLTSIEDKVLSFTGMSRSALTEMKEATHSLPFIVRDYESRLEEVVKMVVDTLLADEPSVVAARSAVVTASSRCFELLKEKKAVRAPWFAAQAAHDRARAEVVRIRKGQSSGPSEHFLQSSAVLDRILNDRSVFDAVVEEYREKAPAYGRQAAVCKEVTRRLVESVGEGEAEPMVYFDHLRGISGETRILIQSKRVDVYGRPVRASAQIPDTLQGREWDAAASEATDEVVFVFSKKLREMV